jgi:hypothetical protein
MRMIVFQLITLSMRLFSTYTYLTIFQDVSLVSSGIQKDASAVESLKVELSQV